jgi:hypothetical protein
MKTTIVQRAATAVAPLKRRPTRAGRATLVLASLLACFGSTAVFAKDISYTYLEGVVQQVDPDGASSETGYRLEGSLGLILGFYGFASWESADLDGLDGDLESSDIGLGWHLGLGDTVHVLAELAYTNREAGPFDEDGYTASVGARFAPTERWEFGAKAGYRDLDRNLEGGYGQGYVLWKPWSLLGLTARAELGEDGNAYGLGARISF